MNGGRGIPSLANRGRARLSHPIASVRGPRRSDAGRASGLDNPAIAR
jgi:hypothetical protein